MKISYLTTCFMNLVIKDAARQIIWRVWSALVGFLIIKIISPYLGTLRYGDYSTIIAYFAIWSAFADFGVYVIWLRKLWEIKNKFSSLDIENKVPALQEQLTSYYSKFFSTRIFMIVLVYIIALAVAYMIPSYRNNPYLFWALPLGMLYSALFMLAGIIQTPLQLYRKMEQVSIWLLVARWSQILLILATVYLWFVNPDFSSTSSNTIYAFVLIIASLVISAASQWIYVYHKAKKYITLQWNRDRTFTKDLLLSNRQYGFAYYLSSFHTLIVTILLSIFFATTSWFDYAWTRWLALQLVTILLIIPSALGNSLIHKLSSATKDTKNNSFGALLHTVFRIWCMCIVWFSMFWPHIINFIWWSEYLSTPEHLWSDIILPFLGIVLTFSFIKQVFNYIFVSNDLQNKLLWINLFGVALWCIIWIPLVWKYNLVWWIIMQVLLEICFLWWALRIAKKHMVLPHVSYKQLCIIWFVTVVSSIIWLSYNSLLPLWGRKRLGLWCVFVVVYTWLSYPWLKKTMKQL